MQIKIKNGLDIPIKGKASGNIQPSLQRGLTQDRARPAVISLNLAPSRPCALRCTKR